MKKQITILLLLFPSFLSAQNLMMGKAEYLAIENIYNVRFYEQQWETNIYSLYFTPSKSLYIYDKDDEKRIVVGTSGPGGHFEHIHHDNQVYTDSNRDLIIATERQIYGPYLTKENKANIEWIISKETKKIGEYNCYMANCKFRGREYEAWFTIEIPINAGPWKLQGLPGLILQAKDLTGEVQYIFKSVVFPLKNPKMNKILPPKASRNNKENSPVELTQIFVNDAKEFDKWLLSMMPAGGKAGKAKFNLKRIEMEFEEGIDAGIEYKTLEK